MENCKTKQLVHTRLHASMPDVMSFLDKAPYNANNGGKEMKEQQQRQNQEEERQTRPKRNNFDASTGMISQDDDDSSSLRPLYLDVRGTPFECCREKLISKSSYFKRMLKDDESHVGSNPLAPIALEYDPVPFEIVLDYIEDYEFNMPRDNHKLCKETMMIAQKLGCQSFLVCCLYGNTPSTSTTKTSNGITQQAKRRRRSMFS
mmetsp:Transcript_7812/g.11222  ORF Transcript_7812/g.11222 Transcript_7812/m.11222 type:complete len:204 (-) Transcript_7812:127-738(-)